ncbi:citrinin biosynthesis oxidoreductase [Diaporthe amygdali]|uniref:citrinin biosynthesis oxidoreductase n=1 Tax=Phomopsis amygdali TaxID=1214568 RepID=UPI0022FDE9F2|nr:citrinin biosynthesis oxidoreductase [Diaporthe amygdali]KAJ0117536.1 citrinin biosynthesis oxidoreductase [Diaporthe amygdali]
MELGDLPPPDPSTLGLPRILMLHGGGTNSRIFHMQCRSIDYHLKPHFRTVYVEAPLPSIAGPDVLTVYAECGPFKRWVLTTEPNAVERQPKETWDLDERAIADAMDADDRRGATGPWVGVLGFSQGAKMAASVLLRQQENPAALGGLRRAGCDFRFGVLMAGRGPLIQPDPDSADWLGAGEKFDYASNLAAKRVLHVPTIHVHGMQDPGLDFHEVLLSEWCEPGTTKLIQWEGNHRLPFKTPDVGRVVNAILDLARKQGVLR